MNLDWRELGAELGAVEEPANELGLGSFGGSWGLGKEGLAFPNLGLLALGKLIDLGKSSSSGVRDRYTLSQLGFVATFEAGEEDVGSPPVNS